MFGSINVTQDVTADLRMRVATAADATALAKNLKNQVSAATAFVDKIDVSTDASDVTINVFDHERQAADADQDDGWRPRQLRPAASAASTAVRWPRPEEKAVVASSLAR